MNTKLTLGEKLKDLRTAKRLILDDISADYLFWLTDLQQHRNIEIDKLRFSKSTAVGFGSR